jgi:hypothetical protein
MINFIFTKEKVVFAVALLVSLSSFTSIHAPRTEEAPKVPPEEAPRPPRITVPVPSIRPEKPLDGAARDPFVPSSAWVPATPAKLGMLPAPTEPRILPGGSLGAARGASVVIDRDPKAVEEPDAPPKGQEGGDK